MVFNGKHVQAAAKTEMEKLRVTVTNPLRFSPLLQRLHDQVVKPTAIFVHYGGDFLNFVGVADGHVDVSFDSCQGIYDIAAIIPLIEAAGGCITHADGAMIVPYDGKRDIVACCTKALHAQLLAKL